MPKKMGVELGMADVELDVRGRKGHAVPDLATQEVDAVVHESLPIRNR